LPAAAPAAGLPVHRAHRTYVIPTACSRLLLFLSVSCSRGLILVSLCLIGRDRIVSIQTRFGRLPMARWRLISARQDIQCFLSLPLRRWLPNQNPNQGLELELPTTTELCAPFRERNARATCERLSK
jgi:hypothetical protein